MDRQMLEIDASERVSARGHRRENHRCGLRGAKSAWLCSNESINVFYNWSCFVAAELQYEKRNEIRLLNELKTAGLKGGMLVNFGRVGWSTNGWSSESVFHLCLSVAE
jgi:hypothetical protein